MPYRLTSQLLDINNYSMYIYTMHFNYISILLVQLSLIRKKKKN